MVEIGRNTHNADAIDKLRQVEGGPDHLLWGSAWGNQAWEELPRKMSGEKVKQREIRLGESVAYGEGCGCRPVFARCFCKDVGKMVGNRFFADPEFTCNLAIAHAPGNELQYLRLAPREISRKKLERGRSLRERAQPAADMSCRGGIIQLLEERQRLSEGIGSARDAPLAPACHLEVRMREQRAGQFRTEAGSLGGFLCRRARYMAALSQSFKSVASSPSTRSTRNQ